MLFGTDLSDTLGFLLTCHHFRRSLAGPRSGRVISPFLCCPTLVDPSKASTSSLSSSTTLHCFLLWSYTFLQLSLSIASSPLAKLPQEHGKDRQPRVFPRLNLQCGHAKAFMESITSMDEDSSSSVARVFGPARDTINFPESDPVWSSFMGLGSGPSRASIAFFRRAVSVFTYVRESESDVDEDTWITVSDVSSSGEKEVVQLSKSG
ncbi:hypothetical protein Tco_0823014 [Tanacetum coccineum]|uniref:Uncharacterized protein n=1 Tax=Tanacetum coccineum TaxID=301880 RepID=A0ABQ5AGQ7_9ASTR